MRPMKAFILFLPILLLLVSPTRADDKKMSFIRDAEIEHYLHELAQPVINSARINPRDVSILIVNSDELNAFVAGGQNIFVYTGLLQAAETPDQLLGVIAHETGHIANGDLIRGTRAMKNASAQAVIGLIAGLAAAMASGKGDIAAGTILGAQTLAERGFLSFSRAQESAADAAAMRFLDSSGKSAEGLAAFMKKLSSQELVPDDRKSEYVRTHPLSQDRIDAIEYHVAHSQSTGSHLSKELVEDHARMQAKLLGFLRPDAALMRYGAKDKRIIARYARTIALYRKSRLDEALPVIDSLMKEEPNNPFFAELKGQMLFENGKVQDAVPIYERAVRLLPSSALLRVSLAHVLLESRDDSKVNTAIENLLEANRLEARDPQTWRFLAAAWNRKYEISHDSLDQGLVFYALGEEAAALGKNKVAGEYAGKAIDIIPKNSPYWLRAQDLRLSADKNPDD